jgi:aquaporin Z
MRSYIMELLGTFLLTFVIVFSGEPTIVGLLFMGLIYLGIHISGAHYNPAVTTAAFVRGKISMQDGMMYVALQLLGAIVAMGLYARITATVWGADLMPADAFIGTGMEALLSAVLVMIILTVCMSSRYRGSMVHGLVAGFGLVALVGLGGLMNPAVAGGAMIVGQLLGAGALSDLNSVVTYLVGPLVGGIGAAFMYQYLNPDER